MDTKISTDTRLYTDIQGLNDLRYRASQNPDNAKFEVAQQFQSIMMQMVLNSMRSANKAFSSDLFATDQMDFYQDMFDKQMSLIMSDSNSGFANLIVKNLDQHSAASKQAELAIQQGQFMPLEPRTVSRVANTMDIQQVNKVTDQNPTDKVVANTTPTADLQNTAPKQDGEEFKTQEDFVKKLWPAAKVAAGIIGAVPEVLIAQAALETNWGKSILPANQNMSSNNLFNLKAGSAWNDKTTAIDTLEQKNGVLYKEKSNFRSYDSYTDSFLDYANFLKGTDRYKETVNKANNPGHFVHELQKAGYATDQEYANKIMKIFKSDTFKNLIAKVKSFI